MSGYLMAFEIVVYCLGICCLVHARRRGGGMVWQLAAGMAFGVLLEWATIWQLHAYRYGHFLVMIAGVPLAIGVAWGMIIYSARLLSDRSGLPEWAKPLLDGLLALNIDLAMDTVAIRLGMWDWGMGMKAEFFGVPYANFWAWFWVVVSFSAGMRLLTRHNSRLAELLAPPGAILIGLLGVLGTNALIVYVVPERWYLPVIAATLAAALTVVLYLRPAFTAAAVDRIASLIPFVFHAFFLSAGLASGVILNPPWLLLVSVCMLAIAAQLHRGGGFLPLRPPQST